MMAEALKRVVAITVCITGPTAALAEPIVHHLTARDISWSQSGCSFNGLIMDRYLDAICSSGSTWHCPELDLNSCFNNTGGVLTASSTTQNYAKSCKSCSISSDGSTLQCQCAKWDSKTYVSTQVKLDEAVTVDGNAVMHCFGASSNTYDCS